MSNPTSNFGWQMPTPTDLVTDLPADFEVFGQAVDSSLADLKGGTSGQVLSKNSNTDMDFVWTSPNPGDITGVTASSPLTGGGTSGDVTVGIQDGTTAQKGAVQLENSTSSTSTTTAAVPAAVKSAYDLGAAAIPKSTVTTNGDLIYGTGSSTVTRLGIGSSGQALIVSGGVPAWGTVAASGGSNWSSLGSSTLSGLSTVTISGISGKNKLLILVQGASCGTAAGTIYLRFNSDSGTNYNYYGITWGTPSTYSANNLISRGQVEDRIPIGDMSNNAASVVSGYLFLDGCNTSGVKAFNSAGTGNAGGGNSQYSNTLGGFYNSSSTISSVSVIAGANFDAGNIYVYSSVN